MALALARKYRPRRFSDLLVQDHVASVLRGAVVRNRGRRLLREAWRSVQARARGFDVVFVARPEIQGAKTPDVIVDMDRALQAAGVTP